MRLPEARGLLTRALAEFAPGYSIDAGMEEIGGSDPLDCIVYSGINFGVSIKKDGALIVLGRRHPSARPPNFDGPGLPADFLESYRDGKPDDVKIFLMTYVLRQ